MNNRKRKKTRKHKNKKRAEKSREQKISIAADELKFCCTATMDEIYNDLKATTYITGGKRFGYVDNGSSVLGVAHLDIAPGVKKYDGRFTRYGDRVVSPMLDDRLGVWIIGYVLPLLGINVDFLITEDEEIGASTAAQFATLKDVYFEEKNYNWLFQFDRAGLDCVMYDYESAAMRKLIEGYGWNVGFGSFSDICYMYDIGVTGFNFGTGYHSAHSLACNAELEETLYSVGLFSKFYLENKDIRHEYDEEETVRYWYKTSVSDTYSWQSEYDKNGLNGYGGASSEMDGYHYGTSMQIHNSDIYCLECSRFHAATARSLKYSDTCMYCEEWVDKFMYAMDKEADEDVERLLLEGGGDDEIAEIGITDDGSIFVSGDNDYFAHNIHWKLSNKKQRWVKVGYYNKSGDYISTDEASAMRARIDNDDPYHSFSVGDRVVVVRLAMPTWDLVGKIGTVQLLSGNTIYVRFDEIYGMETYDYPLFEYEIDLYIKGTNPWNYVDRPINSNGVNAEVA